jgi:hypothetical protein
MSYEEEDTCMSYEEEDTCMSYGNASVRARSEEEEEEEVVVVEGIRMSQWNEPR